MNKNELTKDVADATNTTAAEASKMVDAVINAIKNGISQDGETKVSGFGIFKSVTRKERIGRNPQTGESLTIPEKEIVKFKPYF
ncbi:HU family DNA-binding protein [Flavobacterium psychrophilum]|uniref:HU family DNA-binding protein n=1 Tax=Flavobacterium psychrophilum TaxID=96345 RepID=A0A7U2NEK7_FLAPS|nr:HU family DNA-binding protein [Flavobacterium psychrophilum]QRE03523.1 HU family DNA-binding protein [Flavobacterium psychrophilum]